MALIYYLTKDVFGLSRLTSHGSGFAAGFGSQHGVRPPKLDRGAERLR